MAIRPIDEYPGNVDPVSADYPDGKARDVSSAGAGDGTPLQAKWLNDWFGFEQAVLSEAGITPSGTPEKVGASQILEAIREVIGVEVFGWQLGPTAFYNFVNFDVSAQVSLPTGVAFKPDGTKMYVLGGGSSDAVHQYTLSTAWDVSTASYDSVSLDVSGETTTPGAMFFKPDGTELHVAGGGATESVYRYDLSTAWDLSTASYASVSFDASAQLAGTVAGLFFKPDGTKMYLCNSTDTYQYTLATAWDVSTASYDSVNLTTSGQDSVSTGIAFDSDGLRFFMVGLGNDAVYRYDLSTAWDLSTASYASVSFDVSNQEGNPNALTFKSDGTRMYVAGRDNDTVFEYRTSIAVGL